MWDLGLKIEYKAIGDVVDELLPDYAIDPMELQK